MGKDTQTEEGPTKRANFRAPQTARPTVGREAARKSLAQVLTLERQRIVQKAVGLRRKGTS